MSYYKELTQIQVHPVSCLSFDQSKQLDSPNGKTTPAVLLPLMPNRHLSNFGNAKRLCLSCLMKQKHCCNYFSFWLKAK